MRKIKECNFGFDDNAFYCEDCQVSCACMCMCEEEENDEQPNSEDK